VSELHFLDTGYVLALELANDQNHGAAARHWHGFLLQQPRLVTTSFVFDETVTFFNAHGHHAKARRCTRDDSDTGEGSDLALPGFRRDDSQVSAKRMTHYLAAILWSEEGEGFITTLPDLPGCSARGSDARRCRQGDRRCTGQLDRRL
jgi:hypothetical protein